MARTRSVRAQDAVGRVAAEQITLYRPGIPAVVPGEGLSGDVLDYLRTGLAAGMVISESTDPTLERIRVIATQAPHCSRVPMRPVAGSVSGPTGASPNCSDG